MLWPESGQSIACFHAQTYVLDYTPSLYQQIAQRRQEVYQGECAVCKEMLTGDFYERLGIFQTESFLVAAHPSPKQSWGLVVVPKGHVAELGAVDAFDLFRTLQGTLRCYARLVKQEPAFNIVVRTGEAGGHLHIEIIPRTGTN